jgi:CHAT domain-containing protein
VIENPRKSDYFEEAPKADILHFAMHGCLDASGSYLTNYLQFFPDRQSGGRLTSGEILQFPLKARLAVLASCNTGQGDLSRSEGLKSIARSFILAGCPAVVATLNVVKDATTAEIMEAFYDELQKGASVAEALRKAKLQYCEHAPAIYSHPKYWANIIALGDPRPIYR